VLEHVILKAISRDPADRFQTADEMSRQLAHVQRTAHYAVDPGLARLQEPLPARETARRRSRQQDSDTTLSVPPPPAPVAAAEPEPRSSIPGPKAPKRSHTRSRVLMLLAGASTAALALAIVLPHAAPQVRARPGQSSPALERERTTIPIASTQPADEAGAPPIIVAESPPPSADLVTAGAPAQPPTRNEDDPRVAGGASRTRTRNERPARNPAATAGEAGANEEGLPSIRTLFDEAASAFVLGQMPRARSIYQQIVDRQPTQADAWRGLCLTTSRMGQRKDAERAFARYIKLRPAAADAARIRAQLDKLR